MEVFSASPFRARMEAHGEDSDGLDYESPVEPEQTTRAVASSGSPSRQILRDAPKAVPDRAPRGKHDRRAARRRPIQAPESVYQAARRLRELAPTVLGTVVDFGRHVKHARTGSAVVGQTVQALFVARKHCLPLPQERVQGRPLLPDNGGGGGTDVETLVARTPARLGEQGVHAISDDLLELRSCVEVRSVHLETDNAWGSFLCDTANVSLSVLDQSKALVMFRRALRLSRGTNSAGAVDWGVSLMLALRKQQREGAVTLVMLCPSRNGQGTNDGLQERMARARGEWLTDDMLRADVTADTPLVTVMDSRAAVYAWVDTQGASHLRPEPLHSSPGQACAQLCRQLTGQSLDERAARQRSPGGFSPASSASEPWQQHSQSSLDDSIMSPVMPSHSSGSQRSDAPSESEQLFASPQRDAALDVDISAVSAVSVDVSALSADETREGGVDVGGEAHDRDEAMCTILEDSVFGGENDMDVDQ